MWVFHILSVSRRMPSPAAHPPLLTIKPIILWRLLTGTINLKNTRRIYLQPPMLTCAMLLPEVSPGRKNRISKGGKIYLLIQEFHTCPRMKLAERKQTGNMEIPVSSHALKATETEEQILISLQLRLLQFFLRPITELKLLSMKMGKDL